MSQLTCQICGAEFNSELELKKHISTRHKTSGLTEEEQLIGNIIQELSISYKSIGMYPKGHPMLISTTKSLIEILNPYLDLHNELYIIIADNNFVFKDKVLPLKNRSIYEYGKRLFDFEISVLHILKGIKPEEIVEFHQQIYPNPKNPIDAEVLKEIVQKAEWDTLKINFINFDRFYSSKEGGQVDVKFEYVDIWQDFISTLFTNFNYSEEEMKYIKEGKLTGQQIANIFNKIGLKKSDIMNSIEGINRTFVHNLKAENKSDYIDGKVVDFISGLAPALRDEFIKGFMKYIDPDVASKLNVEEEVLSAFPRSMIEEMMMNLNEQDPKSRGIMQNIISEILEKREFDSGKKYPPKSIFSASTNHIKKFINKLSETKDMEKIVPAEFQITVNEWIGDQKQKEENRIFVEKFDISKNIEIQKYISYYSQEEKSAELDHSYELYMEELNDEKIEQREVEIAFELFKTSRRDEEISIFFQYVSDYAELSMKEGMYDFIGKMVSSFDINNPNNLILHRELMKKVTEQIVSKDNLYIVLKKIHTWDTNRLSELKSLLKKFGNDAVNQFLTAISNEKDGRIRKILMDVVVDMGDSAAPYIQKRLEDSRWFVVRNMIYMLRRLRYKPSLPRMVDVFDKHNIKVKLEIIKTMLEFGREDVDEMILPLLETKEKDEYLNIFNMISEYKLKFVLPKLLSILEESKMFDFNLEKKLGIIEILPDIEEDSVYVVLEKIMQMKKMFKSSDLITLQMSILNSLERFKDKEGIKKVLNAGKKNKNNEIKNLSGFVYNKIFSIFKDN